MTGKSEIRKKNGALVEDLLYNVYAQTSVHIIVIPFNN
jgi:hypothetical protein